ncbi:hypothetical protein D9K20_09785 [Escherichia coli]|nr:hypothetical protein [Escherichia coli]
MTVRILAVCGNGQGSSMIMKMKVDQFLTQSNIDHTVNSCAVGEYKSELSGADINTAKGALDVAKEFNGDVQIELTGYWTWEQAQQWRDAGIQQVVYHRSRDAQAAGVAWGEADITAIKRLSDMGFKVTVTGGLALEDLPLFKGIPIHVFIAGRSIRDAASPVEAARQFKRSIAELWG